MPAVCSCPSSQLYEKIYAPLTADILHPFAADPCTPKEKITALNCRYKCRHSGVG